MDDDTLKRIHKLEMQMAAMIDHYNEQDDTIERMGFDIRSIFAGINEFARNCHERHRNDELKEKN